MKHTDENKELRGIAGTESTPAASRAEQARNDAAGRHSEGDTGGESAGHHSADAGNARSPAAAHAGEDRRNARADAAKGSNPPRRVSGGGSAPGGKSVESDHVMGTNHSVRAEGAEGFSDEASSKANRKEAGEPEREAAETRATGSKEVKHSTTFGHAGRAGQEAPAKNAMGHGQRETVARNTI